MMLDLLGSLGHPTHEFDRGPESTESEGPLDGIATARPVRELAESGLDGLVRELVDHFMLLIHGRGIIPRAAEGITDRSASSSEHTTLP